MNTSGATASLLGAVLSERYELSRLIARGGMGDVYEAKDGLLRRQVAVKVFRADALADRSRFDTEVHTLAALSHPGLVQVFDAGEHQGDAYVVLELIDGASLRSVLAARKRLSSTEVAAMGVELASALAYVHGEGVVHRDVNPSNILCGSDGRHRLADFGIARLLDTSRVTAVTTMVGTAAYMAPEQVEGRDVTPAADVYALGLVLIEALTGHAAFVGVGHEVALARLARDPEVDIDMPPAWRALLTAMTARSPGDRPTTGALIADLACLSTSGAAGDSAQTETLTRSMVAGPFTDDTVPDAFGDAQTEALALEGGTTVMPAALRPAVEAPAAYGTGARGAAGGWPSRRLWMALAVIVALVVAALASGSDLGIKAPSTTTAPVVTTVPVALPPATPSPTTQPPNPGKDKGHGKRG